MTMADSKEQPSTTNHPSHSLDSSAEPQHLNTLRHEPTLVSCPSCHELTRTVIERVSNANSRLWPFNICLPCLSTSQDLIHKCQKCYQPLAIAKSRGNTEVVLPVAVRRNISREELSRPRSARLPNGPNFSRPGTASNPFPPTPAVPNPLRSPFQSRFPPPVPDQGQTRLKVPLSIVIGKANGMESAGGSVVELPHVSPKSPRSLTPSHTESDGTSMPERGSIDSATAPSTSDVFHSMPPSPLPPHAS